MSDHEFESRVARALRASVPPNARAKAAIMDRVRVAAREEMPRRILALPVGRTARHSLIGLALAAGIGSITTLSALAPKAGRTHAAGAVTSTVIGDSVVDRLRDTMRLVRLIFDDPAARQVAVVGDFNDWRGDATRMQRDVRTGKWTVTLALHDGDHRYAIVVDETRADTHTYSLLHVARAAN